MGRKNYAPLWLLTSVSVLAGGCVTAGMSTYHLVEANQALVTAQSAGAPEHAIYAWTQADEFMHKAREEWAAADFGPAEQYARTSKEWSEKATSQSRIESQAAPVDDLPEDAPKDPPMLTPATDAPGATGEATTVTPKAPAESDPVWVTEENP